MLRNVTLGTMMSRGLWACTLLVVLAGCREAPPKLSPLPPWGVVLAFGDSLTHGTGAPAGQSYPSLLEEMIGRQVVNGGVPGEVSSEGLARLPAWLDRHQPQLLILCHGGNDILRRKDGEKTAANLRAMVRLAQAQGVEVVLLGVPEWGFVLEAADFYAEIAAEEGVPYQGEVLPDIFGDSDLKSDSIHPNARGYRILAEAVAELLDQAGAL